MIEQLNFFQTESPEIAVSTELKPCPFCGEKGELRLVRDYWVTCYNFFCGINPQTSFYATEAEAVSAWNKKVWIK